MWDTILRLTLTALDQEEQGTGCGKRRGPEKQYPFLQSV